MSEEDERDYCKICENILNEYEGDICCSCEGRFLAEEVRDELFA